MDINSKSSQQLRNCFNAGYSVDKNGIVLSPKGTQIKTRVDNHGYLKFSIRIDGSVSPIMVHQLQALCKYGERVFKTDCVRHFNAIKTDNSYENILIGTNKENQQDIPFTIRKNRGIIAASNLIKHNKIDIIEFYNRSNSYKLTMNQFNISSKGTLWHILNK